MTSPSVIIAAAAATIIDRQNNTGIFLPGMVFAGTDVSIFTGAETGMPPLINNWKMLLIAGQV